jgi:hypothetical protein
MIARAVVFFVLLAIAPDPADEPVKKETANLQGTLAVANCRGQAQSVECGCVPVKALAENPVAV